ncbi:2,5-didehydrogluconate reductase [Marinicauda pacifica]|jgi:diketogulonate reductase-like aldo/keto reductase|uniref:Aldo/keto reductase n=1 Tax=Marinicauda pacifica TaxID=1133559 RepID=A0A4S2H7Q2_9PROT|nr:MULTISPECIES: aldo/keto reductase [Marinicauda]TGY91844.1 aldo/keto reductase [Marinicauda pacifica]GGE50348.1 2,5-didehydrogluconate reductase [Marinicauda pacifica]
MVPVEEIHGATIPKLGFGTWQLEGDTARDRVKDALDIGYRHIDTAQAYDNEEYVGAGIQESGVARDDIWLTTKVWLDRFKQGDLEQSLRESLVKLKTDTVDLALLHWPNHEVALKETIEALNNAKREGLTRNIGISNFPTQWMGEAVELSEAPLIVNQVEFHPFIDQRPVLDACKKYGMGLTAYCPIAQANVIGNDTIEKIADRHGKSAVQVALRWLIQQDGVIAIPRSSSREHAASNFEIFDFELSDDEMAQIGALHTPDGRIVDPKWAPAWDTAA